MPLSTYPTSGSSTKVSKTFTVNIGLENNPMSNDQLTYSLPQLFPNPKFKFTESTYLGAFERTLVMQFTTNHSTDYIKALLSGVCVPTEQDCVAVSDGDTGFLVYPPDYDGVTYKFDSEFFVSFND
mgnify:FL=1